MRKPPSSSSGDPGPAREAEGLRAVPSVGYPTPTSRWDIGIKHLPVPAAPPAPSGVSCVTPEGFHTPGRGWHSLSAPWRLCQPWGQLCCVPQGTEAVLTFPRPLLFLERFRMLPLLCLLWPPVPVTTTGVMLQSCRCHHDGAGKEKPKLLFIHPIPCARPLSKDTSASLRL